MQRGVGNVNPMKMAKCIKELERIYGVQQLNDEQLSINKAYNFYKIGNKNIN